MEEYLKEFFRTGAEMVIEMHERNENWKNEIRKEWCDSIKLPRKKKKLRRKELLIDWSIANWDCGFMSEDALEVAKMLV